LGRLRRNGRLARRGERESERFARRIVLIIARTSTENLSNSSKRHFRSPAEAGATDLEGLVASALPSRARRPAAHKSPQKRTLFERMTALNKSIYIVILGNKPIYFIS
jgi:hypothetical protein